VHLPFSFNFRSLDFRYFTSDSEGYFMLCYGKEFEVEASGVEPFGGTIASLFRGQRHPDFPLLSACRFAEFDTSIICL